MEMCFDIERCDPALGACVPACPQGEVFIPRTGAGGFIMGRGMSAFGYGPRTGESQGHGRSDTPHRVVLTRPFCMDATEVTAGAMLECVEQRGCKPPARTDRWSTYMRFPDHPVNMVNYNKAKYFCEQYGKSLPTEAQWEWAATGGDPRKWPWGDEEPTCERADFTATNLVSPGGDSGCHGGGPSRVGAHPKGDREWPSGRISDLAGNVWEWALDSYLPFEGKEEVDPLHQNKNIGNHVIRGGGWNRSGRGILATFRAGAIMTYQVPGLGFRCVRNPKPLPGAPSL
jgi:formylglycine-generating enzyme required for sulfatase activity